MGQTNIEWADRSWNILGGCTAVSPGCTHCYARRMSWRLMHNPKAPARYRGTVEKAAMSGGGLRWTGRINLSWSELLDPEPLRVRVPAVWFVASMGDLFHPKVPLAFIHELWGVMEQARHHTFIVLTKRSRRMQWVAELLETSFGVLPNVIGMVTVENQVAANRRIVELLMAPFACRGVSLEPMLGSIDLEAVEVVGGWRINALTGDVMEGSGDEQLPALDGVILGGETGPGARAMRPEWARGVVQQCQAAGVAFTFKRWGDYTPVSDLESWEMAGYQEDEPRGGRVLCGRVWDEFPVSISTAN